VPAGVHDVLAAKLTEQMPIACGAIGSTALGEAAFDAIAAHFPRVDCVAIGPGLGRDAATAPLVRRVIAAATCPVVIDADALYALGAPDGAIGAGTYVLTPHVGEASRLTGLDAGAIEAARVDAPRDWAARWNAVVVLKGAPTVVAAADRRAAVNPTGNAGMATAGMGDVLTGAIAALVAQGLGTFEAAALAVHAHGLAGDTVAVERGPIGLVAGDVCEALPGALAVLERGTVEAAT
jgi:NAD(P)H-hydrate epimerase